MKLEVNQHVVIVIAIVLIALLGLLFLPTPHTPAKNIAWFEISKNDFTVDLIETGEIKAIQSMFVKAPHEWRADLQIIDMVPEGIMVEKGDFLLQFDTGYLETELGAAQSQMETHRAELRRLKAEQDARMKQLHNDLTNAQYAKQLAKLQLEKLKYESESKKSTARLEIQKAEIAYHEASTKIKSQKILDSLETEKVFLNIAKEKVKLEEVNSKMAELTLRAPISGLVVYYEYRTMDGRQKYKIGDKVNPGMAVIEIPDLSQMEVVFHVHEMDRDKIALGQKVKLTLEAFPEQTFEAQVREVARLAEAVNEKSQVKHFTVKATIENNDAILKPGMTAKVRIILNQYNDVIAVPCTAVLEKEGQPVVLTVKKWPQSTSIKMGARNNHFVIVESGLQAGDKIAWPVPIEIVDNLHHLGYKQKIQREFEETNWVTKNLEEMKKKGLDFDYATFRQHKAKGAQAKNDSLNLDVRKGILKMPDGRMLSLPDEVLEKMKSTGRNIMMKALPDHQKPQKKMGPSARDSTGVK